jgi:hypothetical protein
MSNTKLVKKLALLSMCLLSGYNPVSFAASNDETMHGLRSSAGGRGSLLANLKGAQPFSGSQTQEARPSQQLSPARPASASVEAGRGSLFFNLEGAQLFSGSQTQEARPSQQFSPARPAAAAAAQQYVLSSAAAASVEAGRGSLFFNLEGAHLFNKPQTQEELSEGQYLSNVSGMYGLTENIPTYPGMQQSLSVGPQQFSQEQSSASAAPHPYSSRIRGQRAQLPDGQCLSGVSGMYGLIGNIPMYPGISQSLSVGPQPQPPAQTVQPQSSSSAAPAPAQQYVLSSSAASAPQSMQAHDELRGMETFDDETAAPIEFKIGQEVRNLAAVFDLLETALASRFAELFSKCNGLERELLTNSGRILRLEEGLGYFRSYVNQNFAITQNLLAQQSKQFPEMLQKQISENLTNIEERLSVLEQSLEEQSANEAEAKAKAEVDENTLQASALPTPPTPPARTAAAAAAPAQRSDLKPGRQPAAAVYDLGNLDGLEQSYSEKSMKGRIEMLKELTSMIPYLLENYNKEKLLQAEGKLAEYELLGDSLGDLALNQFKKEVFDILKNSTTGSE